MGPWGRIFPRRISGRPARAPGPPNCGFWALSGGTWPDPRLGTPRGPSGRIFARRPQGGSGRPVRAPGGRIRPESTCFPVAPGRLRGPETPHSGPTPGAPGAAGPERAPRVAPQEARSPSSPRGEHRVGASHALAPQVAPQGAQSPASPRGEHRVGASHPLAREPKRSLVLSQGSPFPGDYARTPAERVPARARAARAGNHPDRWAGQARAQEVQRTEAEMVRGAQRCGRDQGLRS